jgi:hypothetical protein
LKPGRFEIRALAGLKKRVFAEGVFPQMKHEVDTDLIVQQLRRRGHNVGSVIPVPDNAGEYEFSVDGILLSLEEARTLIQRDAEG